MLIFRDNTHQSSATERASHRGGELITFAEARIRGNYRDGPVPVTVRYTFLFKYAKEWNDETGNTVNAVTKDFDTSQELDLYVRNHFTRHEFTASS